MKALAIFTAFLLTFQCSKKDKEFAEIQIDNQWVLEQLMGFEESIEGNNGRPTLKINLEESSYSGNTGCNSYSGKLAFGKVGVKLLPALMTKRGCDDKGLEKTYMECLEEFSYYKLEGQLLKLFKGETLLAVFKLEKL